MAPNNRDSLAKEIFGFRQAMEWTQDEMARKVGVTAATISRWEAGIAIPKPKYARRMKDISRASGGKATFLGNSENIREQEQLDRTLIRATGVLETHKMGKHTVQLLEDGSLMIDDRVRIS